MVRITPEDDPDRLAERLRREAQFKIQDRDSFDLAFNNSLSKNESELTSSQKAFRDDVFKTYVLRNPAVSQERIFKAARGRSLKRDRRQTADEVVLTKKEYIKKGSKEVDLKGYDTARQKATKDIRSKKRFRIPAMSKQRIVLTEKISVKVRGKSQVRFRDRFGRFASRKR